MSPALIAADLDGTFNCWRPPRADPPNDCFAPVVVGSQLTARQAWHWDARQRFFPLAADSARVPALVFGVARRWKPARNVGYLLAFSGLAALLGYLELQYLPGKLLRGPTAALMPWFLVWSGSNLPQGLRRIDPEARLAGPCRRSHPRSASPRVIPTHRHKARRPLPAGIAIRNSERHHRVQFRCPSAPHGAGQDFSTCGLAPSAARSRSHASAARRRTTAEMLSADRTGRARSSLQAQG